SQPLSIPLCLIDKRLEARLDGIPGRRVARLIHLWRERVADQGAAFGYRFEFAERDQLDEGIAQRRCLTRSGDHSAADGIRCHLAQYRILRSPADDVQHVDLLARDRRQQLDHVAIFERKALEDTAGYRGW